MDKNNIKRQLAVLLGNGRIPAAVIDERDAFVHATPSFLKLSGFKLEDLQKLQLVDVVEQASALRMESSSEHGGFSGLDCQLRRENLTQIWVNATATATGSLLLMQVIDIDLRKQAEVTLSLDATRLNFALLAAAHGVWDHDTQSGRTYYSPEWFQMRGIPLGEAVDGSVSGWIGRIHPDDRDRIRPLVQQRDDGEGGFRVLEYRERHRDGRWIWIHTRGQAVAWDQSGNVTRSIGTDTDVTDRKQTEQELQQVSQRLELALDASKIGVWEEDLSTGEIVWDRRMYEIYGSDLNGQLQDYGWDKTVHPADREAARAAFEKAVDNGSGYVSQFRILRANGEIRHLRSRARVFHYPNSVSKVIGAEWDVTADVDLSAALEQAKALAEARYAELVRAHADILHAALHDQLTDLPNRRFFNQMLLEREQLAATRKENLALLHIDLDHFKVLNDTLGHAAGDAMLQHVGNLLRTNVRDGDFIARLGGDEFVILCKSADNIDTLTSLAERIIAKLEEKVSFEGNLMHVGASIGIACAPADHVMPLTLLRNADDATYRAKNMGRNRYALSGH